MVIRKCYIFINILIETSEAVILPRIGQVFKYLISNVSGTKNIDLNIKY